MPSHVPVDGMDTGFPDSSRLIHCGMQQHKTFGLVRV